MRQNDPEFIQILNIIRRGQRLVLQARNDGADTSLAEELISEAKYALKLKKKEEAIEYAKKCIVEVIRSKREMDQDELSKEGVLEHLTKEELRQKCKDLGIESLGLKSELVERLRKHLRETPVDSEEVRMAEEVEDLARDRPEKDQEEEPPPEKDVVKEETPKPDMKKEFDVKKQAGEMIPGLSYIIEEKRPDKLFQIYKELLKERDNSLAISRSNPNILVRTYGLDEESLVWLTGKEVQGEMRTVLPILEFIMSLYDEFMDQYQSGIILLDGLEYLLTNNKFNSVLRFIRQLVDNVSQSECILMVSLSPDALDSTEVTLLEKDLLPLNFI